MNWDWGTVCRASNRDVPYRGRDTAAWFIHIFYLDYGLAVGQRTALAYTEGSRSV